MRLTIRKKLYGGFSVVLLLLIAISIINYVLTNRINSSYSELINNRSTMVSCIKDLNIAISDEQANMNEFLLTGNKACLVSYQQAFDNYNKISRRASTLIKDGKSWEVLQGLNLLQQQYIIAADQMIDDKKKNNTTQYTTNAIGQRPIIDKFNKTANKLVELQQSYLNKEISSTNTMVSSTKVSIIVATLITLLFGLSIAFGISNSISKPIIYLAKVANKIADGDLTIKTMKVKNNDEIGDLVKAFTQMSENLYKILKEVEVAVSQVASSADELTIGAQETSNATRHVASITQELAVGTESQACSVKESVGFVNQMDRESNDIAANAEIVTRQVTESSNVILEGNKAVQKTIEQMNAIKTTVGNIAVTVNELSSQSNEINQIIGFITNIASQTSLLSLNASIEAARAGEAGKGFAVVAEEVRHLAEQTTMSGQQISDVINSILQKTVDTINIVAKGEEDVRYGIEAVNEAGTSFNIIQTSINEVKAKIQQVSKAANHMSEGTDNLVNTFEAIEKVSQNAANSTQNVSAATEQQLATMEDITNSAASLRRMSDDLMKLINTFKFKETNDI